MKTWEMLRELAANPEQRYKSQNHTAYIEGSILRLKYHDRESSGVSGNLRLIGSKDGNYEADQWTLIPPSPQPVPFMEAVKAKRRGKEILYKFTDGEGREIVHRVAAECLRLQSTNGWIVDVDTIDGVGQWFIVED